MEKAIALIGMISFLTGACAMDSESLVLPVCLTVFGLGMILVTIRQYEL